MPVGGFNKAYAINPDHPRYGAPTICDACDAIDDIDYFEEYVVPQAIGTYDITFPLNTTPETEWEAWRAQQSGCHPAAQTFIRNDRSMTVHQVGLTSWHHPAYPRDGSPVEVGFVISPDDATWATPVSGAPYAVQLIVWDPEIPGHTRVFEAWGQKGGDVRFQWDGLFYDGEDTYTLEASDYFIRAKCFFEDRVKGNEHKKTEAFEYVEPRIAIKAASESNADYTRNATYIGEKWTVEVVNSLDETPFDDQPQWTGTNTAFGVGYPYPPDTTAIGTDAECRFWTEGVQQLQVTAFLLGSSHTAIDTFESKDYFMAGGTSEGPNYGVSFGAYASDISTSLGWNDSLIIVGALGDPTNLVVTTTWNLIDTANLDRKTNCLINTFWESCSPDQKYVLFEFRCPGDCANHAVILHDWRGWDGSTASACPVTTTRRMHVVNCHGASGHGWGANPLQGQGLGALRTSLTLTPLARVGAVKDWADVKNRMTVPYAVVVSGGRHSLLVKAGSTYEYCTAFACNANLGDQGLFSAFAEFEIQTYLNDSNINLTLNTTVELYE